MGAKATVSTMPEDERRSILTEREKEILAGEANVTEKYYYVVVTRVRKKIEGIEEDLQFLEANHEELATEMRDIVCDE